MNLQALIDGMSAQWQRDRAETQMTLGKLIKYLEHQNPDFEIRGLGDLISYRGYYSDLCFEPEPDKVETASELLIRCKSAMGQLFEGYKGGDFMMGEGTPLWVADYGGIGVRLMSISVDGVPITEDEPEDE